MQRGSSTTCIGFKRRATAVLKSNLIRSIEFGKAVARRLKRALDVKVVINLFELLTSFVRAFQVM